MRAGLPKANAGTGSIPLLVINTLPLTFIRLSFWEKAEVLHTSKNSTVNGFKMILM